MRIDDLSSPKVGALYARPKVLGDEDARIAYVMYWPHVANREEKFGLCAVVDKVPEATQTERARKKIKDYAALALGIKIPDADDTDTR